MAGVTGRETDFRLTARPTETLEDRVRRLARLRETLAGFRRVAVSRQHHGTAIALHDDPAEGDWIGDGFDGHLTGHAGVLLAVTVADCIPVYLLHPPTRGVALLHAGWRGTAAGVLERGIDALCRATGGSAWEIVIHCGVGVCGACYEVGPEVIEALGAPRPRSPVRLDLRRTIGQRATAAGIGEVTVSGWCTGHDHDRFHSHRQSGGHDGRMVAYLGRPAG